ncbi:MAG TPA: hypothetical protein PLV53_13650, partial [Anaerolineaceae bacterium]|nr:hypothetical protein [Anaerolineaceae bacterium]
MPDLDNILEEKLQALENGAPIEQVLASLTDDAGELAPLLELAATMRAMPHPEPVMAGVPAGES